MRKFKDVGDINLFIKKINKESGVKVGLLEEMEKDNKGCYIVPEGTVSFDVASLVIHTYGKTISANKKLHAYLKKEGYACKWIRVYGGNKVSFISITPTETYKKFNTYY